MIRLRTLGSVDLRAADGREIHSILSQPKRLALLVYLAVQGRQTFLGRDQVLALFWPEHDDKQARGALNRALYFLRGSLGEGVLLSRGNDAVGFAGDALWCDAVELEAAAAEARHERVLELYGGDLLEGFNLADTVEFGRWIDSKRERLRELACRSAWSLADAERRSGNHERASHCARWAVERSPYDEASVRRLLILLDELGDRAGAVHEFEQFERRLAEDLELAPAPETRLLVELIRSRRDVSQEPAPLPNLVNGGVDELPTEAEERTASADVVTELVATHQEVQQPVRHQPEPTGSGASDAWRARKKFIPRLPRGRALARATFALALGSLLFLQMKRPTPDFGLVLVERLVNRTGDPTYDALAASATERIVRSISNAVETASNGSSMSARVIQPGRALTAVRMLTRRRPAGTVVSGEIYREDSASGLRFSGKVVDAIRGDRPWAIPEIAALPDAAVKELSQRATGAVVALRDPRIANWFPIASTPPTYEALAEYQRSYTVKRPSERGEHFVKAAELDSTFTWAWLEAAAGGAMPDRVAAQSIVARLESQRDRLNSLQMLVLDSRLAMAVGDRTGHYQAMRAAANLAPGRFLWEYASSASDLHLPRETLEILDRIDAQAPNAKVLPTWAARLNPLHELGEYRAEYDFAERGKAVLPRNTTTIQHQISALAALGEAARVVALVDTAVSLPTETLASPGAILLKAAEELRAHGNYHEFERMAERAIAWYRNSPASFSRANPDWHEGQLAGALYLAGRWEEARELYEKLLDTEGPFPLDYYSRLGAIAARRGDRAEAGRYLRLIGTLQMPTDGEAYEFAFARARITLLLGDADRALSYLIEGYGGAQGVEMHTEFDFEDAVRTHPGFQQFVRPKG